MKITQSITSINKALPQVIVMILNQLIILKSIELLEI